MNDPDWAPDVLGPGYDRRDFDLGTDPDGEGAVRAVLVRRAARPGEATHGAVLYVHGFSDYFFQTELADFFANRGLQFYGLDLRKCGRARNPGHTAHYVSGLPLYDDELDRALAIVTAEHPGEPVIIAAHSTGGLIVPLWLHRRRLSAAGPVSPVSSVSPASPVSPVSSVAGVVLNSPWLDLQGGAMVRGPVTQALRVLAKLRPFQVISMRPGVYGQTLHVSGTGEWEFDTAFKPLAGFPVTYGWLHAIRRAHAFVHRGIETGVPTLVLRSSRSLPSGRYSPQSDRADLVLDTRQIGRWAGSLGRQVTDLPVEDARHDVFLSLPEVRAQAYAALGTWLDQVMSPAEL